MSRATCSVQRAGCRGALLGIALLGVSANAQGQSIAELEEKVKRLEARSAELAAKADSMAQAERMRWSDSLVTIDDGGYRLLVQRELAADTREAAALASRALIRAFGDSVIGLVREQTYLVYPDAVLDSARSELRNFPELGTAVLAPATDRVRVLALNLVSSVYQQLWQRFDQELREWVGAPLSPTLEPERLNSTSYIDLVTSPSPVARACYRGDRSGCLEALGIERPADPAETWYDEAGRRELVGRLSQMLRVGSGADAFARCTRGQSDEDCRALLRLAGQGVPPPLTPASRGTLLRVALMNGGPTALTALLANPDSGMGYRLALSAGQPLDALVGRWYARVVAAKPTAMNLNTSQAAMVLFWGGLLALLAFRSSRWR